MQERFKRHIYIVFFFNIVILRCLSFVYVNRAETYLATNVTLYLWTGRHCKAPYRATQLNSTSSWVVSLCTRLERSRPLLSLNLLFMHTLWLWLVWCRGGSLVLKKWSYSVYCVTTTPIAKMIWWTQMGEDLSEIRPNRHAKFHADRYSPGWEIGNRKFKKIKKETVNLISRPVHTYGGIIMTNRNSTTGFPTSYRWRAYYP